MGGSSWLISVNRGGSSAWIGVNRGSNSACMSYDAVHLSNLSKLKLI